MSAETFPVKHEISTDDRLEELRVELDLVDESLREALHKRFDVCVRIAEHKREHAVPMMQPHRIDIVQERAAKYAIAHGIDPAFIRKLYELIIAETCRVENVVIDSKGA